jgi:hypothetical protein
MFEKWFHLKPQKVKTESESMEELLDIALPYVEEARRRAAQSIHNAKPQQVKTEREVRIEKILAKSLPYLITVELSTKTSKQLRELIDEAQEVMSE